MRSKDIKKIFFLAIFALVSFSNQSQAVEGQTSTSSISYKIKHMFSFMGDKLIFVDNKLNALNKALPTLTYKTLDFKAGIGMDFGSNGIAIGLVGNIYHSFTPNISAFTGVEYKYNMHQTKHKISDPIFTPETRTKMDLLFKLGAKFKVKENFKVSPYVIFGMGYGSVKQETQNLTETTENVHTTRQYEGDGAKRATKDLNYDAHKDNFKENYGVKYKIDETATETFNVHEVKSGDEAQNILNNSIDMYKNTMKYESPYGMIESYMNLGILPIINIYKNNYQKFGASSFTLLEGSENGVSPQYSYQTDNTTITANGLSDIYQTIIGNNNGRIFAIDINQDYSKYAKDSTDLYNTASILNQLINSGISNFDESLSGTLNIQDLLEDILKQKLDSGELQLSNVEGLSQTQEIMATDNPLDYSQTLMVIKAKNLQSGENVYFYYLPKENGETTSFDEAKAELEDYNNKAVVDKREQLEDEDKQSHTTKLDTIINQQQKTFFKGGLGIELMFYDRFFMKLEYKYAQLEATNVIMRTNVTRTSNITETYGNKYVEKCVDGDMSNYNNDNISGYNASSGKINEIEIQSDGIKNISFSTPDVVSQINTTNKKATFHMHEISFGFGFYFL